MVTPRNSIGRSWNSRPITDRLSASTVFVVSTVVFFSLGLGCFQGTVHCAGVKEAANESVNNDGAASQSQTQAFSFNCPTDWKRYQDSCFKLIQTSLKWDEARDVCESYDGVLADLQNGVEWKWVDEFVHNLIEPTTSSNSSLFNLSSPMEKSYMELWAGIQQFPNGTFLWNDGLRNLVVPHRFFKANDKVSERKCVEIYWILGSKKSPQWRVADCEQTRPFVCKLKACSGSMVHCPRESRCVSQEWMCDGHADCNTAWDETMCKNVKNNNAVPQVKFCGETFKMEQGRVVSPNHPSPYPPLSHCTWIIETHHDRALVITVHKVIIQDGHDILRIYQGVKLTTDNLRKDLVSSNESQVIKINKSFATIQFLSDATDQRAGFTISWKSEHQHRAICNSGQMLVSNNLSAIDFNASKMEPAEISSAPFTICDWLLTSSSAEDRVSLQILSLVLDVGESFKVFDGSDQDGSMLVHYTHSQDRTEMTIGSHPEWMSRFLNSSLFIPSILVSFKNSLRLQLKIRSGSSAIVKFIYYLGCQHTVTVNPVMVLSPGFSLSRYPNNLNCSWTFQKEFNSCTKETTLLLFPGFRTEDEKDVLKMFDHSLHNNISISSPLQLSGTINELHALPFASDFSVQFTSDSTINKGQWFAMVSCDDCDLPKSSDGLIVKSTTNTKFGSYISFSCMEGYAIVGHDTAFCSVFGTWHPTGLPACTEISCGSPSIPRDGYLSSLTGLSHGSVAIFQCQNGYRLHGNQSSVCGSGGWSEIPSCQEIVCSKDQPPDGGNARAEDLIFGALREYFCKEPYRLVGSKFSHCNASGMWTDEVPRCESLGCPLPPRLINGKFKVTGPVSVGQSIEASCDDGFVLNGPKFLQCRQDLSFGLHLPKCIDVDECLTSSHCCGPHHCQNNHGGYHCMCRPGFQHPDSNKSTECEDIDECAKSNGGCSHKCMNTPGNYSCQCPYPLSLYVDSEVHIGNRTLRPFHTCVATCPSLVITGNGQAMYTTHTMDNGHYLDGTKAVLKCPTGSYLDGESFVSCNASGHWTPSGYQCKEYKCDIPPAIPNGKVVFDNLFAGSHATYTCHQGFKLRGQFHRFCLPEITGEIKSKRKKYSWTASPPLCEITLCPSLSDPKHGKVYLSSASYKAKAVFKCECGYRLVGKVILECTANGNWSDASPFCEVESCSQPDIPEHAVISHRTPGFPAWTVVKYQCQGQGYEMDGQSAILCMPGNATKTSNVNPLYQVTLQTSFSILEKRNFNLSTCLADCQKFLASSVEGLFYSLIHRYCSGMDVNAFHYNTVEIYSEKLVRLHSKVSLASDNKNASYTCGSRMINLSNNDLYDELGTKLIEHLDSSPNYSSINLESVKTNIEGGNWHCWNGLTLVESAGGNICLQGCIENTETIDELISVAVEKDRDAAISSFHEFSARHNEGQNFEQFQYPVQEHDEATTITPTTKMSITNINNDEQDIIINFSNTVPPQTEKTTSSPVTPSTASSFSTHSSSTTDKPTTRKRNTLTDMLTSSIFKARKTPQITSPHTNTSPFDLDSKKDREYFTVDDSFPARPPMRRENDQSLWRRQRPRVNCSTSSRLQRQAGLAARLKSTSRSFLLSDSGSNTDDCLENQMLEKQETKLVHAPTQPSVNLSSALYTVEVRDRFSGSFFNISCVDAVHMIINAKVNEILQQFGQRMGHNVCREAYDAALELVAGNIRFKGTTARVYIKFAITHSSSPKSKIVDCGTEFESFVKVQLPKVLGLFLPFVLRVNCVFINYTSLDFTVAHKGWTCRKGYTLHESKLECNPTPQNHSFTEHDGKQSLDYVKSLPRLKINFNGVFNVLGSQRPARSICVHEYKTGISVALSKIEPHLQGRFFQCTNLYIQPFKNVSVLVTGKRIIAKTSIDLIPLKAIIDLASMTKCSRFLSLHFREPSHLLSTVTLGQSYLPTCPPIRLMPHGIRANLHFIYYCPIGFYYEAENFKCVHELLPLYSSSWTLEVEGQMDDRVCQESVQQASVQFIRSIGTEIKRRIHYKHICNGTTGVILIPKDGHFEMTLSKMTIKLTVSITSLKGLKTDVRSCMTDIHKRLDAMLVGAKTAMVQKVVQRCESNWFTISRHPNLVYTRWECRKNFIYNTATGRCDSVLSHIHMKGIKSTRYKRLAKDELNDVGQTSKLAWSGEPPSCNDVAPPVFLHCPKREITIVLDHVSPKFVNIPLPTAVDNSGIPPKITYEPSDFVLPYKFSQNMSLIISASDQDGNKAVCKLPIVVLDHVPPVITCPTELVRIPAPSTSHSQDKSFDKRFLLGVAQAWDNSGYVTVKYEVMEGVDGMMAQSGVFVVKATAEDESSNMATCSFFAKVVDDSCSVSSLGTPVDGFKQCVRTGGNPGGLSCSLSCESGKLFAVQPPIQYICANNNAKWVPHDRLPACYDTSFPDFEITYTFNVSYRDVSVPECVKSAMLNVKSSVKSIFRPLCGISAMENLNFTVQASSSFFQYSTSNMISSTIKVFIHKIHGRSSSQTPVAVWCGSQGIPELENWINSSLRRHCLGRDIAPIFNRPGKNITCAEGWTLVNSQCVECPAGTYWSNLKCLECPLGSFQSYPGKNHCSMCTIGFSTRTAGAKSQEECYAICPIDSYSPDGLRPCLTCPVGMYQGQDATRCNKCDEGSRTSQPACRDVCVPGTYSLSGKKPCYPCPLNTYSTDYGMTHCHPCPDGFITTQQGTIHLKMCQEHNPCKSDTCKNDGRCDRRGDQFICNCTKGFKGLNCESTLHACDRNPCMNGGTCLKDGHGFNCTCQNGYTGIKCETRIDYCNPDHCLHGLCVYNDTGYDCQCSPGFEGLHCEIDQDDCKDVDCLNGGYCVDLVNNFQCVCKSGYSGEMCEINTDDCANDMCLHGSTCIDGIDFFSCQCSDGFSGQYCESVVNNCDSSPCQNGGICDDKIQDFMCTCPVGYTGRRCEERIDFCVSNPCWNNGKCANIYNTSLPTFSCSCEEGFTGVLCQNRTNLCFPMPCSLEGTERCDNGVSSLVCVCRPGWTGSLCDQRLNSCEVNRCLNGGSCINHDGHSFSCNCLPNFTGFHCSELVDKCQPNPCHNKGECFSVKGREPSCLCSPGFTGEFCQDNVDECHSFPCQNGGTCQDGVNSFFCRCSNGYAGVNCGITIDACLSQPCQGTELCEQENDTYRCFCPQGKSGQNCEEHIALGACHFNPCLNQGKCTEENSDDGSFHCECLDGYVGDTCQERLQVQEEQTSSFDLRFSRPNAMCQLDPEEVVNVTSLSMCLWVQSEGDGETDPDIVTLKLLNELNETQTTLVLSGKTVKTVTASGNDESVAMTTDDGLWHHMCFVLDGESWKIYKNGTMIHRGQSELKGFGLLKRLQLHLGQSLSDDEVDEKLSLSITDLNIYGHILEDEDIHLLVSDSNCIHGDILGWEEAKICGNANVDYIVPSTCHRHSVKSLHSSGKKKNPTVSFCPDNIHIVSDESPAVVLWKEPLFDSVSDIVSLSQSFRSGQAFSYGHHLVSYVAKDSQGNMASCNFHVFISRFTCTDPPPPANGARVCGEWHHGRYCIPSCLPYFMFVSPVPPFYLCGKDGIWNPSNGQPFQFPICSHAVPPVLLVYGILELEGPVCDSAFLEQLENHMTTILTQVNYAVGLCGNKNACDYEESLRAECGERKTQEEDSNLRPRRDVENKGFYYVKLNITIKSYEGIQITFNQSNEWIIDDFVATVKKAPSLNQFHLSSVDVNVDNKCKPGAVGMRDSFGIYRCVECPSDHEISDQMTCDPCPQSWYNDEPGKQACKPCPKDQRSQALSKNCLAQCTAGTHFHSASHRCSLCPKGEFQDETGTTHCKCCPSGYWTKEMGSMHSNDCLDICLNGQELGAKGICLPCPAGWFKNRTISPHCLACPYAWTTPNEGAVSVLECSLRKCKPGHFLDPESNNCLPCPLGTFQSIGGVLSQCQPCGVGLTTVHIAADRQDLCVEGAVNECVLGIDDCPEHMMCIDEEDGLFICRCKFGIDKHGACILTHKRTSPCELFNVSSGNKNDQDVSGMSATCKCDLSGCKGNIEKDYTTFLETLAIYSLTTTAAATILILMIVALVVYRRQRRRLSYRKNRVRLYREEKTVSAFQNNAFILTPSPISMITHTESVSTVPSSGDNLSIKCYTESYIGFDLSDRESI